ncbi:MAG: crossover junction endodeoxyribonuclease RuvC [Spirochaetes bacterium]|nr:crossover junction endodeoxyribonuclease RuvC [Spirochaetota bacterium]MBU0955805.1 crossover junction endodeoxyribonuclease RuvC [Spirochaetota bacterium]
MQILGIDPGLASLGWGVVEQDGARLVYKAHGCLSTKADMPPAARLAYIRDQLLLIVSQYQPQHVAMEGLFFSRNVSSAFQVAEVRGVIRLSFYDAGLQVAEYLPNAVKQAAAGSANAGKADVQNFVKLLLGLQAIPKPDHAADALAVAICHAFHQGGVSAALAKPR